MLFLDNNGNILTDKQISKLKLQYSEEEKDSNVIVHF